MAATAAMVAVSIGSAVYQHQVSQRQKGIAGQAQRDAAAAVQSSQASAPDVNSQQAIAATQAAQQAAAQRKRALASFGRSDTILTGPRGIENAAPTQRKTLLGL